MKFVSMQNGISFHFAWAEYQSERQCGKRNPCEAFGFIQFPSISTNWQNAPHFPIPRRVWKWVKLWKTEALWSRSHRRTHGDAVSEHQYFIFVCKRSCHRRYLPASLAAHICSRKTACCFWIRNMDEKRRMVSSIQLAFVQWSKRNDPKASQHITASRIGYAIDIWIWIVFAVRKAINFQWQRIKVSSEQWWRQANKRSNNSQNQRRTKFGRERKRGYHLFWMCNSNAILSTERSMKMS